MRTLAALAVAPLVLGSAAGPAGAVVDEVTPSTNELNAGKGWAHVTSASEPGAVELTFVTSRTFDSCFEYRADGEPAQEGLTNPNPAVTDGLWDYVCVNATGVEGGTDTETVLVRADETVEVRLVFGAERDERFDWTAAAVPGPVVAPDTAQECKDGGFAALGYSNQGRCVSAVRRAERDERKAAKAEQRAAAKAAKATAKAGQGSAKDSKKAGKKAGKKAAKGTA